MRGNWIFIIRLESSSSSSLSHNENKDRVEREGPFNIEKGRRCRWRFCAMALRTLPQPKVIHVYLSTYLGRYVTTTSCSSNRDLRPSSTRRVDASLDFREISLQTPSLVVLYALSVLTGYGVATTCQLRRSFPDFRASRERHAFDP